MSELRFTVYLKLWNILFICVSMIVCIDLQVNCMSVFVCLHEYKRYTIRWGLQNG